MLLRDSPLSLTIEKINGLNADADEFLPSIAIQDVAGNERQHTEARITVCEVDFNLFEETN